MSTADTQEGGERPPIVVIVGPTAAGKSRLAMDLARAAGGEVVSADSQQVYRGMDIGTGKVSVEERGEVAHHLIDLVEPDEAMTAMRWAQLADQVIADLATRGRTVVVAGGTMLYVRALLLGIFEGPPASPELRARLEAEAMESGGSAALWERLREQDPLSADRIDATDLKRIVRALEVYELTGTLMSEHQRKHDFRTVPPRYRARILGLAPEREQLYRRIDARVDQMIAEGWVDEVRGLRERGYGAELRSQRAIGYSEIHRFLSGDLAWDEAVRLTKRNSRRYARRQLSWYRSDERLSWFPSPDAVDLTELGRYLRNAKL